MCHVYGQLGGLCIIWLFDMNALVSNYKLNDNNKYFIIIIITIILIYHHWNLIYLSDK